ncbi:GtrA family protein [Elioraea sp.]|uniref:GtrA family protein n=1 Tax=Elioraea sp. TaxID=2185103 RepID=UPI003F71FA14
MTDAPITAARLPLAAQMLRFGLAGTAGFVVDTATVYLAHFRLGLDLYSAGALAYLTAATMTWLLNRHFTFPEARAQRAGSQWLRFIVTQLAGFALNRGTYAVLIATLAAARAEPVIAVAAGSLAGMTVNFLAARFLVFREGAR